MDQLRATEKLANMGALYVLSLAPRGWEDAGRAAGKTFDTAANAMLAGRPEERMRYDRILALSLRAACPARLVSPGPLPQNWLGTAGKPRFRCDMPPCRLWLQSRWLPWLCLGKADSAGRHVGSAGAQDEEMQLATGIRAPFCLRLCWTCVG